MTLPIISTIVVASLLAASAYAGPGGGHGGGGSGPHGASSAPGAMGPRADHGSPSGSDRDLRRMDDLHRRDAPAREQADARRAEGLAQADASRREPPAEAVGFWTRARRILGFSKSAEQQADAAREHEQASEKRPVGP